MYLVALNIKITIHNRLPNFLIIDDFVESTLDDKNSYSILYQFFLLICE